MYSAMAVTAGIAIAAVAVNVLDTTPNQPSAGAGATHVVAVDGSGDFSTITEAVLAAVEGDTVLVRPGNYVEAIVIEKNITLEGDGPREVGQLYGGKWVSFRTESTLPVGDLDPLHPEQTGFA